MDAGGLPNSSQRTVRRVAPHGNGGTVQWEHGPRALQSHGRVDRGLLQPAAATAPSTTRQRPNSRIYGSTPNPHPPGRIVINAVHQMGSSPAVHPLKSEGPPMGVPIGAEDGIRTRDPHLGKVMRYHCATSAWANTLSRRPPPEQKGQSGRPRPRVALLRRRRPPLRFDEAPVSLDSSSCARTRTRQS